MKCIDKSLFKKDKESTSKNLVREILLLSMLAHPNVCPLLQVVNTPEKIYIVSPYQPAGSLFSALEAAKVFSESQACQYWSQLVNAVEYCHLQNVIHRDLKLENSINISHSPS